MARRASNIHPEGGLVNPGRCDRCGKAILIGDVGIIPYKENPFIYRCVPCHDKERSMLTVELKVNGKAIGLMEIHRVACDDKQGIYMAQAFEQKLLGDTTSVSAKGIEHWRPDGAWRLVEKAIGSFKGQLPKIERE